MITINKIRKKRFDWEINLAFDAVVCDILLVRNRMANNRFAVGGSVCIEFVDRIRIKTSPRPLSLTLVCLYHLYRRKTIWTNNVSLSHSVLCRLWIFTMINGSELVVRAPTTWYDKLNHLRERIEFVIIIQCALWQSGVQLLIPNCTHNRAPLLREHSLIITKKKRKKWRLKHGLKKKNVSKTHQIS